MLSANVLIFVHAMLLFILFFMQFVCLFLILSGVEMHSFQKEGEMT